MGLLDGKRVLITGARKGIGRGIAITLANEGAHVGVNDILDDEFSKKILEIISSKGVNATFHKGDVSKIKDIFCDQLKSRVNMKIINVYLI